MIRIEGLRKEFDQGTVALEKLDLVIKTSTFLALLGPSGCGKTTTLNCIAGLLEPTAGRIWFDDQDVTALPPRERNLGMVFQSYALYPHMKVIDNIAFPLKQKGMKKPERHQKARETAKRLQIEHLLDRRPAQLSGGQQQRVAMARALAKEPRILLLDEPMSNLDARLKIEIRDEIKRLQQDLGLTAIIVTHDQEEAMAIADKIAILDNGCIQQFDTPEVLYHYPANLFVAHFMGNPPMNFIDAVLKDNQISGDDFSFPVPKGAMVTQPPESADRKIKIGVRSHQIQVKIQHGPHTVKMELQIVENLGKELLLAGMVGKSFVRVTMPDTSAADMYRGIRRSGEPYVYLEFNEGLNLFDTEKGVNLSGRNLS
ncbi:sugar ABC transporter ATP-binding protein [Spirochaetia bacterium]|nr:sugar ABC transporter ATP-binding protein [Spirochaetia bacterium]